MATGSRATGIDVRITFWIDGEPLVNCDATTEDLSVSMGDTDASSKCNPLFTTTLPTTRSLTLSATGRVDLGKEFIPKLIKYIEANKFLVDVTVQVPYNMEYSMTAKVNDYSFPGVEANVQQDFSISMQDYDGYEIRELNELQPQG